jgi:hypothetical protein
MSNYRPGPDSSRRRSQRVILSIPVKITGKTITGEFSEDTETLAINAHGALITLAARVAQGQEVEIKSRTHPEKLRCKIVFVGPSAQGKTQFGIEFLQPAPHFWHIAFPPEDWVPVLSDVIPPAKQSKG